MPKIVRVVVEQHVSEAGFTWLLRDRAVAEPHYLLADLKRFDRRVDAHLDGLRIAGDEGWAIALEQLEAHTEPGETFACANVAFLGGNQARIARVLEAAQDPANARGVISAIAWLADERKVADYALQLGLASDVVSRRIGVAIAGIRRLPYGPVLQAGLVDKDPGVVARSAHAIGELGAAKAAGALRGLLNANDLPTRFWAAWSLAIMNGESGALAELKTVALTEHHFRRRAVDLIARRGEPRSTVKWFAALDATPGGKRLTVQALGAIGDPDAIPKLLDFMADPALARVAGEAFAHITGAHISYDKLERDPPEGFVAGPTEDPADEDVALDPDGNLYWPDAALCAAWWSKNKSNFSAGNRYLDGKPIAIEHLRDVLKKGYQRKRAAAALELAMREPGKPLYEVRAPGFRQS